MKGDESRWCLWESNLYRHRKITDFDAMLVAFQCLIILRQMVVLSSSSRLKDLDIWD